MNLNERLDYIISNQSDNINNMRLADVCSGFIAEQNRYDSPLYMNTMKVIGDLITLVLDELKFLPELDKYTYESPAGPMTSVFYWATFNNHINIQDKDMDRNRFLNATFSGGVTINSKIICDAAFKGSKINCSIYVKDGCTDLGEDCFCAIWGDNSSLSLPESLEFIDPYAFYTLLSGIRLPRKLEFRGTIKEFNVLVLVAEEDYAGDRDEFSLIWPKTVECIDGVGTIDKYYKSVKPMN